LKETKQSFILSLIFIQLISEISKEQKERGELLFRIFRIFMWKEEEKLVREKNDYLDKILYYRELCKNILSSKFKDDFHIEQINDILFTNVLTSENLKNHKSLINSILKVNQENINEIYLLKSENDMLRKELKFWIYDYENIKKDQVFRVRMNDFIQFILKNREI